MQDTEDLYNMLGYGGMPISKIAVRLRDEFDRVVKEPQVELTTDQVKLATPRRLKATGGVIVDGEEGCVTKFARCCNPLPGDPIVGFITRGRGVSVHRANCPNVKGLMEHPERMIDVEWDGAADTLFQVEIVVECLDRMGLLKDVTIAIGDAGGNILSAATSTNREGIATLRFMVEISDASGLDPLLASISSVDSVYDARRLMPGEGGAQLKRRV